MIYGKKQWRFKKKEKCSLEHSLDLDKWKQIEKRNRIFILRLGYYEIYSSFFLTLQFIDSVIFTLKILERVQEFLTVMHV